MRVKTGGECILVTLATLGCLGVLVALLAAGGYFYFRSVPAPPATSPIPVVTPSAPAELPRAAAVFLQLEETSLGEDQSAVQRRFPKMVLREAQTVPLIHKGFAHGEGTKEEPAEFYFRDHKVIEIRFATSLKVNGRRFLAVDKPTLASLSAAVGVQGEEMRLTQMSPVFWIFKWDDQELSVVVLDQGHFFSLNSCS